MKNINKRDLKNTLYMTFEEYVSIIRLLLGRDVQVDVEFGDLSYEKANKDISIDEILNALSDYYEAQVTSVHTDGDVDCLGIWIVYKRKEKLCIEFPCSIGTNVFNLEEIHSNGINDSIDTIESFTINTQGVFFTTKKGVTRLINELGISFVSKDKAETYYNDGTFVTTELCPYCNEETVALFNSLHPIYTAVCVHCGNEITLCDECLMADDNPFQSCDWQSSKNGDGGQSCFRCKLNHKTIQEVLSYE